MKKSRFSVHVFAMAAIIPLTACLSDRDLIVSFPVASMTQASLPQGQAVTEGKEGNVKFCEGDKAISTKEATVGVLDELILRAERQSKSKFIRDVQLFRSAGSANCFELDYKAGVLGAANARPAAGSKSDVN
ncbi:MAG: hypothetical protein RIR26_238 [Pseudomonadota bacterium]|jgi:hypothetical protein